MTAHWIAACTLLLSSLLLTACRKPEDAAAASPKKAEAPANHALVIEGSAQQQAGIIVQTATARAIAESVTAPGRLAMNEDRSYHVGAITEGRVAAMLAKVGDIVQPGQVLARLHSHDVHEYRSQYQKSQVEVLRAKSAVALAERNRDRYRRLYELKAGSLQSADQAEGELRDARAALARAQADEENVRLHLTEFLGISVTDEPHEDGKHDDAADYIPTKAPARGTVIARNATVGSVVDQGAELFTLSDLSSLWMIANVSEQDLPRLRPGMSVRITVQSYPTEPFQGRVLKLGEELDPTTRTLKVRIAVPNPRHLLKPEMFATAELAEARTKQAIYIPAESVQDINGQSIVFVRREGRRFEPRPVTIARTVRNEVEVQNGLAPGDVFVSKGGFVLKSQLLKSSLGEE